MSSAVSRATRRPPGVVPRRGVRLAPRPGLRARACGRRPARPACRGSRCRRGPIALPRVILLVACAPSLPGGRSLPTVRKKRACNSGNMGERVKGRAGGEERHMEATEAREGRSGHPPLKRGIGRVLLLFFVIGDIVGAGIYALVGEVGAAVGGAIWTAFLAAFVLAIFTAASSVDLVAT